MSILTLCRENFLINRQIKFVMLKSKAITIIFALLQILKEFYFGSGCQKGNWNKLNTNYT